MVERNFSPAKDGTKESVSDWLSIAWISFSRASSNHSQAREKNYAR